MKENLKKIVSHKGFRKYGTNTLWLLSEKILRMTVGLFVGVWVARYLGPDRFGLFSYVQSFVGLFIAIATLGLDNIVIRELVKNEDRRNELLGTAFSLKFIGSIVLLSVLGIVINFTSNDRYTNNLVFIVASATLFQSFNVIDFYFQSKVLSKYVVYTNVISLCISSIIKITLIVNSASLIAFAWVVLFDSLVLSLGLIYFYIKKVTSFKVKDLVFNKVVAVALLRDSWPLILSSIVISVYMKIDQVMIKEMLDNEAVGQYAVAVRLSEIWYFIPMVMVSSLFPAIINAKEQDTKLYFIRLQKLYDFMVWTAIAIAILISFLGDWMVNFLYGEQYNQSASVLIIHIWAGVFVFLGVAFGKYLIAENLTKKSFYRTFLGAVCNVGLNFVLIPKYGIRGAAVATLCSQFIANYGYDIFDKDLHNQLIMKTKSFVLIQFFKGYK